MPKGIDNAPLTYLCTGCNAKLRLVMDNQMNPDKIKQCLFCEIEYRAYKLIPITLRLRPKNDERFTSYNGDRR